MSAAREHVLPFVPRPWQEPLIYDRAPRIVCVVHRRAGKSTSLLWRALIRAAEVQLPMPRVLILLPLNVQWDRTGLWDQLKRAARAFPKAVIRDSERAVRLANGATVMAGGADNPDAWRGGYADEVICDEFEDMNSTLVPLVIEPMLADRGGSLVLSGTPHGRGLLATRYHDAGVKDGWSRYLLPYTATGALPEAAIERMRAEMSEEEFAQELCVSFDAPNSGSYFGKLLHDAATSDPPRIREVPHDPMLPVHTGWDLGIDDATAIWFAQVTRAGEWRWLEYVEDSGQGLDHYARILKARSYTYGRHLLPHDAAVRELGTGKSRVETLAGLGIRATVVPAQSVADGINALRLVLPRSFFDERRTDRGLKALRGYSRAFNAKLGTWEQRPRHDQHSHGADAARTLVMGLSERGAQEMPGAHRPGSARMPMQAAGWDPFA